MTLASPNTTAASRCALAMPFPVQAQTPAHIGHLQTATCPSARACAVAACCCVCYRSAWSWAQVSGDGALRSRVCVAPSSRWVHPSAQIIQSAALPLTLMNGSVPVQSPRPPTPPKKQTVSCRAACMHLWHLASCCAAQHLTWLEAELVPDCRAECPMGWPGS